MHQLNLASNPSIYNERLEHFLLNYLEQYDASLSWDLLEYLIVGDHYPHSDHLFQVIVYGVVESNYPAKEVESDLYPLTEFVFEKFSEDQDKFKKFVCDSFEVIAIKNSIPLMLQDKIINSPIKGCW